MDFAVHTFAAIAEAVQLSAQLDDLCGPRLHLVGLPAHVHFGLQRFAFDGADSFLANCLPTGVVPVGVDLRINHELAASVRGNEPAARNAAMPAVPEIKNGQSAAVEIEERGKRPAARYDQVVAVDQQIALRRWPAERHGCVRMLQIKRSATIVHPEHVTGLGIQGVDKNPFERPDAGCKVNAATIDDRTAACRPRRDQPAVANDLARRRRCTPLPDQPAVVNVQAIQRPIIRREVRIAVPEGRSRADRAVGIEPPPLGAGLGIERRHAIVPRRADHQRVADDHRLVPQIELNAPLPNLPEGRLERRILPLPLQMKLVGQDLRRTGAAARVVPPLQPIIGATSF